VILAVDGGHLAQISRQRLREWRSDPCWPPY